MADSTEDFDGKENGDESGGYEEAKRKARETYRVMPLYDQVRKLRDLAEDKAALEDMLKGINAKIQVLRYETIPETMENAGIERISYQDIGRVSLSADMMVSVKARCKDLLINWLNDRNLGSIVQPTISSSTLKAFIKRRIEGGLEIPSESVNMTPVTRASITRASK